MFREIAYKYGHVTKQFEIDLYNAYALATQKPLRNLLPKLIFKSSLPWHILATANIKSFREIRVIPN